MSFQEVLTQSKDPAWALLPVLRESCGHALVSLLATCPEPEAAERISLALVGSVASCRDDPESVALLCCNNGLRLALAKILAKGRTDLPLPTSPASSQSISADPAHQANVTILPGSCSGLMWMPAILHAIHSLLMLACQKDAAPHLFCGLIPTDHLDQAVGSSSDRASGCSFLELVARLAYRETDQQSTTSPASSHLEGASAVAVQAGACGILAQLAQNDAILRWVLSVA